MVGDAKRGDPLAPVTVVVRDNIGAVGTRRALARGVGGRPGVAAVDVVTLRRVAEQVLAAAGETRPPVTSARLTAIWRGRLVEAAGCFEPVVHHAATVRALVRAHGELREADGAALAAVAALGELGADLVRLHREVTRIALDGRRDEVAVLEDAAGLIRGGSAGVYGFGEVILYLPDEPSPVERSFVEAMDAAAARPVTVLLGMCGVAEVDEPLVAAFGGGRGSESWRESGNDTTHARAETDGAPEHPCEPHATRILHASDSDDEVRAVIREVRALLADGAAAHRIAVLHAQQVPYGRLLHDHLAGAGIAANGPGVRALRDRAVADAFLTLLALDPDDLRRAAFFDWLGRAPIRLSERADAASAPRTRWERLSREAGVTAGDWGERLADHEARQRARLAEETAEQERTGGTERDGTDRDRSGSIAYRERAIAETQALAGFVAELRTRLAAGRELADWAAFGAWALELFHRYLGRSDRMNRLPEDEQRAATGIEQALGAITELDGIGMPPTLEHLVEILEVDLDGRRSRVGRFGDGVFVGPVDSAPSLDVDHVFVLGLDEDLYPGRAHVDPLLPDALRVQTGGALDTARDRLRRRHRAPLAAFAVGGSTATIDDKIDSTSDGTTDDMTDSASSTAADAPPTSVTATFPRGDLRRGAERLPSRWLMPTLRAISGRPDLEATRWSEASGQAMHSVASHWAGIARADRPATEQEWRLRTLADRRDADRIGAAGTSTSTNGNATADAAGNDHDADAALPGDTAFAAAVALIAARRGDAFTRFDGNLAGVDGLPDYAGGIQLVSPTALEKYAGCSHAFFVERLLGVRPLESPEEILRLRTVDSGSIIHTVLDRLVTESPSLPGYGEAWTAGHRERMREIADQVMDDFERRGLTGHPRLWATDREALHRTLDRILDIDDQAHAERDSRIIASELPFGMRDAPPVRITIDGGAVAMRGSADRVDETLDGTLLVTDFKTGSAGNFKGISNDPVAAGTKLQLPLYAHAARDAFGRDRVEAAYWFVGKRDHGTRIPVVLDDTLERTYADALATLVGGIRDGHFLAKPPATDDFMYVQCPFCNPDGVGYGHVRGPSERKRTDAALRRLYGLIDPSALPPEPAAVDQEARG
ncbi:hypothetical protein BJ978_001572 [Agromyces terreus]|uniref:PD-(D/E)XK endonuclease-like domain-containing protein n=1 Tax=Agromyces terreus TaxID=424795 RepID=A0A9X2H0F4_9MICO|nr:PD-(D/E)XK nuclease family protein [Agromyces terreus]MCP2370896.1 hypothetical protein [Agromyces terreus]